MRERLHVDDVAVFLDLEVFLAKAGDRLLVPIEDDDVELDEIGARRRAAASAGQPAPRAPRSWPTATAHRSAWRTRRAHRRRHDRDEF